ncbi:hypothetical protein VPH35_112706 [Triticum aestivum]
MSSEHPVRSQPPLSGRSTPPPEAVHRSKTMDPAATMSLSCYSMAQLLHLVEGTAFPLWNASVHEVGVEKEDGICWLWWSHCGPRQPLVAEFVASIISSRPSVRTPVTACVALTTICVTSCSITGLQRTVTPAALLPLPEAARALPGLISCYSDDLLYIAEVPYPLNGTSTRMQQLG